MGEIDDIIVKVVPYYKKKKQKADRGAEMPIPSADYKLIYDSSVETLEPVYFWILDYMRKMGFKRVEKYIDNFASSPGSGHFSELQGKASQMQQEASRVLGTVNNILKGVLNLIYDLKEFKIRLSHYEAADSNDSSRAQAGLLSLKQMWMDKVDIQRGVGSINALTSGDLNFVTLRDAFLTAKSVEKVDKELDLNERVKRLLKPRLQEFFEWKKRSYQELKKRYEIEKIYLKSQVDALKLNARWARPYLRAANRLASNDRLSGNAAMVTAFNTILFELCLVGMSPIKLKDEVMDKRLPRDFKNMKNLRTYNSIVVIDFNFRGIPSKAGQHYTFGGRAEVSFKSYSLTSEEISLLEEELKRSDLQMSLSLVEGMTTDSLMQIQADIDEILSDKEISQEKKKEDDLNPFSALFSIFKSSRKEEKKKEAREGFDEKIYNELKKKVEKKENYAEKFLRDFASAEAGNKCFNVYDIYKKGHGMAAFPFPHAPELESRAPFSPMEEFLGFKHVERD